MANKEKRPKSKYARRKNQPLRSTHKGHNPPVYGCPLCEREGKVPVSPP